MELKEIKKNDIIKLKITGMTSEGSGVGRYFGAAILVPQTAIGDEIETLIIKTAKNYAVGKINKIISPSSDRTEIIDCPVFSLCGGCEFRHIKYDAELRYKEQRVKDAVSRIGGLSEDIVKPTVPCSSFLRYRNKAQIPLGIDKNKNLIMGFYANHSHRIVNCDDCLLQPEVFSDIQSIFKSWCLTSGNSIYDETTKKGNLRHIYIRCGNDLSNIMVCIVTTGDLKNTDTLVEKFKTIPEISSIILNFNTEDTNVVLGKKFKVLFGDDLISDNLCGLELSVKPLSFYQVNRIETSVLYNKVKEYANPLKSDILLDLYCGTGTIGLTLAKDVKKLYGAEIIEDAVKDARSNAKKNDITNAEFLCMDAAEAAKHFSKLNIHPDIITVDPPRKGCSPELIETIKDMGPKRVVYVSCDPATLARDLKIFCENGFSVKEITPVDMFPRTANVECVALLSNETKI